jgi:transposase
MRGRKLVINWQEDAPTLQQLYKRERDAEIRPRLHALWLLRAGHSMRQVAELVSIHYVTLQQWVAWYRAGGVEEVRRHKNGGRQGRACLLSNEQIERLTEHSKLGLFRTADDVRAWVATTFDVHYRPGSINFLLSRLGWKPKTTRPQAITASPVEQEEWKKGVSRKLSSPKG